MGLFFLLFKLYFCTVFKTRLYKVAVEVFKPQINLYLTGNGINVISGKLILLCLFIGFSYVCC